MARDANTANAYPDSVVMRVAEQLLARLHARQEPWLVGLSGLQGSGKSTFSAQLAAALTRSGIATLAMSIDDFYFGRRERQRLAREVHPLLATRGVPGTHDLVLLERTLADMRHASASQPARVPRFDKGRDTRMARAHWHRTVQPPRLVLLEGWCVGVLAQTPAQLRRPINALERDEDGDGRWRGYVNTQLAAGYARLWRRFDALVLLQAPSFDVVQRWRDEQEMALRRAHAPHAMSTAALRRFIMHYERLSRQALRELPARADICLVLDAARHLRRIALAATGTR